jgi:hypothetical protein
LLKEHQFINVDMAVKAVNWDIVDKVVLKWHLILDVFKIQF